MVEVGEISDFQPFQLTAGLLGRRQSTVTPTDLPLVQEFAFQAVGRGVELRQPSFAAQVQEPFERQVAAAARRRAVVAGQGRRRLVGVGVGQ